VIIKYEQWRPSVELHFICIVQLGPQHFYGTFALWILHFKCAMGHFVNTELLVFHEEDYLCDTYRYAITKDYGSFWTYKLDSCSEKRNHSFICARGMVFFIVMIIKYEQWRPSVELHFICIVQLGPQHFYGTFALWILHFKCAMGHFGCSEKRNHSFICARGMVFFIIHITYWNMSYCIQLSEVRVLCSQSGPWHTWNVYVFVLCLASNVGCDPLRLTSMPLFDIPKFNKM
jgi:hypothetical protein